jgi:hypothetical protein
MLAAVFLAIGSVTGVRFLYHYLAGDGNGYVQSVIFTALCMMIGVLMLVMGLIADIVAVNRKLLERIDLRLKYLQYAGTRGEAGRHQS